MQGVDAEEVVQGLEVEEEVQGVEGVVAEGEGEVRANGVPRALDVGKGAAVVAHRRQEEERFHLRAARRGAPRRRRGWLRLGAQLTTTEAWGACVCAAGLADAPAPAPASGRLR